MPQSITSSSSVPPAGVWVPVPTFFTPVSPSTPSIVDLDDQVAHALFLEKSGITGIVLLGSTGESVHISRAERSVLISAVRSELPPHYPLMIGTASNSVEETVELLKDAKKDGGDFGLVLAPGYFAPQVTQSGLVQWYTKVADKSPLPILIYHYPGVSNNVSILPETIETLSKHNNIVGAKFSHGDVSRHGLVSASPKIDHENFRLFSGLGQQLASVVLLGGAGVIDGLAATFPRTAVELYKLSTTYPITKEAVEEIRKLQYLVSKASETVCVKWGVVGIKECIHKVRGYRVMKGGSRLPMVDSVSELGGRWEEVEGVLGELEEIEQALAGGGKSANST